MVRCHGAMWIAMGAGLHHCSGAGRARLLHILHPLSSTLLAPMNLSSDT